MATAVREPRLDKALVPNTIAKDQASVGVYFEYTYGLCSSDPSVGGEVQLRNVSLFAVDKMLFMRRSVAEVLLPLTTTATFQGTDVPTAFRADDKLGLGRPLTADEAFLTVMRAWEFATQRPKVSHILTPGTSVEAITVGAHALINEPLLFPISGKDTEAIRKGDASVARRINKQAEAFWLGTASERTHDDGTPAHRFTREAPKSLDTGQLIGRMVLSLIEKTATEYPEYSPVASAHTDVLPEKLKQTAESMIDWS